MKISKKESFLKAIKQVQNEIAEKFEARAEIQKGITSPDLQFGD